MSKVYGQKPTNAISAVVRHDELADSVTQESDLERQQSVGQIGETLPLVFCKRVSSIGGTWVSPRIIGIGLEQDKMSLIFPLSAGRTGGLDKNEIFIGIKSSAVSLMLMKTTATKVCRQALTWTMRQAVARNGLKSL